jgi:hypothetical protein
MPYAPALSVLLKLFVFAGKFQGCDRGRAFKIWDCLSEASFPNLARPTEQTGPEGEIIVGAPFFWVLFLGRVRKVPGLGAEPRSGLYSIPALEIRGISPLYTFKAYSRFPHAD